MGELPRQRKNTKRKTEGPPRWGCGKRKASQNYLVPKPQPREVWVKLCRLVRLLQGGEALRLDQTGARWPRAPFRTLEPAHSCRAISQQPRHQQGTPSGRRRRCALRTTGHSPSPADVPFNALRPLPYRVSHLRPLRPPPSLASAARPVPACIRARPLPRPLATPRPARCPAARCAAPSHTLANRSGFARWAALSTLASARRISRAFQVHCRRRRSRTWQNQNNASIVYRR